MASNIQSSAIDLSGLPETVVRTIRQLVQALKDEHAAVETTESGAMRPNAVAINQRKLSADEVENLLDELSSVPTGKILPANFSRADIYDDRD